MLLVRPRHVPSAGVWALAAVASSLVALPFVSPALPLPGLWASIGFSLAALAATASLIPPLAPRFLRAGLKGKDLLKTSGQDIPESIGLIAASVYILLLTLFIPFPFSDFLSAARKAHHEGLTQGDFPHQELSVYLAALLSLLTATLLGFLDDIFDIRWRHKVPIPLIASIPLLLVYYAEGGITQVVVPKPLRSILGNIINLGPLYYLYMSLLSTFCTNSINILAGINGIEAAQALVIASSVALNDLLYLPWPFVFQFQSYTVGGVYGAGMAHGSSLLVRRHLLSLYFMLPLIGTCLGFLYHNWYPARVFPGDTLCYFSGMAFAVVGILGHFSKTLLLFFIPQIFNFVLSCPQLFGLVPCPRHRLPRLDIKTSKLVPSLTEFPMPPPPHTALVLHVLAALRLTRLTFRPDSKSKSDESISGERPIRSIASATNLTILNVILVHAGPMREKSLARWVIGIQVLGSCVAFGVRYGLAGLVYDGDRR